MDPVAICSRLPGPLSGPQLAGPITLPRMRTSVWRLSPEEPLATRSQVIVISRSVFPDRTRDMLGNKTLIREQKKERGGETSLLLCWCCLDQSFFGFL